MTSCALLLSLSNVAYAETETSTETPSTDYEKGYILTPVETQGANTITKYEFNQETNKLEPVYYQVDLAKTEYGEGDTTKYFEWSQDEYDNYLFGEVAEPTDGKTTISVHYDSTNTSSRIENLEGTNYGDINSNFIHQDSGVQDSNYRGGAIYNNGVINGIYGDFIENSNSYYMDSSGGGAIYNDGVIDNIEGNFISNYSSYYGGAIHNAGIIDSISGNFIGNETRSFYLGNAGGGAISNFSSWLNDAPEVKINSISGVFIGNSSPSKGGAIYNTENIGSINGTFIGNYSYSLYGGQYGGAIYNEGEIGNITGDFIGNYAKYGGAISTEIGRYDSTGAYQTTNVVIGDIKGSFINNAALGGNGGALYASAGYGTEQKLEIGNITGDFINNSASSGGAIYLYNAAYNTPNETLSIGDITGDFINNSANNSGGAIYNHEEGYSSIGNISGSFINNHAGGENINLALGGAIYTNNSLDFLADGQTHYISGNYTEDSRGKIDNAIFVETSYSSPTLTFTAQNGGKYIIDDQIEGGTVSGTNINYTNKYNLKLTGDKTGEIVLNNSVINADTTLDEVTLHLTKADILASSTLTANSGHLSLMNGIAETQVMQGMNINGHLGMSVDVDLQSAKMDRLPDNVVVSPDAQIDVEHLNLLNDAKGDKTDIQFADKSYSNQVSYTGDNEVMYKGTAYSPIYKYDVSYNKDDGFFTFLRGGASSGNASDGFNPAVLSTGVAAQAGAYATQMNTFHYAFQHLDNFMNLPYMERLAIKNQNRYALTSSAESGIFSPTYAENLGASYWIKPYVSFESIPLNNGPKVNNINYGTLIGFDGEMKPIAHGFDRVLSGYVGYNGTSQSYSGVDSYQNGGLLGGTMFLYKGNFFNATTLSVGASIGENHNMYGHEDFTMLLAGIGNRLGYNFEFKGGKYIIQPSMLMSYTFVNTFDYTNSAGLNIESDPMHVIQLSPGVKFIMNTRNGWQPYATVNMVWNIMDSQKVTANAVRLPEMSVDPYVQYGLGVQKRIKDKFVAFGQALVSNGGRNGVSLTFGLRWFLGKE